MDYPIGAREAERLNALRHLAILDTRHAAGIDLICALAAELLQAPISAVSLIDQDRQWFKARCGVELSETARQDSFSNYTILNDHLFIVPDTHLDPRFAHNPLVVGAPYVRFYAGAPLALEPGLSIGALCVIDRRPRTLDSDQKKLLEKLSELVVDQIRLHEALQRIARDRSAHLKTQEALEARQRDLAVHQRMLQQVEHLAGIGAWEYDLKRYTLQWSDEVYRIYDLPVGARVALETALLRFTGEARAEIEKAIDSATKKGGGWDLTLPFCTTIGRERWVHAIGEVEYANGEASRLFGTVQDVSEVRAKDDTIRHLAHHDGLTGLANRAFFQERLEAHVEGASRGISAGALVLLDIDRFKEINDKRGHMAGDVVLTVIARRLQGVVRDEDVVARIGGDEFAILCPGLSRRRDIEEFAQRLLAEVGSPVALDRERFKATLSIGVTKYPDHAITGNDAIRNADIALYRSKDLGRNRFTIFEDFMLESIQANAAQCDAFERALSHDELIPYYQPIIDPRTRSVSGFEALARWRHPEHGLLAPGQFPTVFEQENLATGLTRRMLHCVIEDMAVWAKDGVCFGRVGINVTTFDLLNPGFADEILRRLSEMEIPSSWLIIELTEQVVLSSSFEVIAASLQKMATAGVLIAFDDFGTGHASLTHITSLPVHVLKLDRSFIKNITTSATCRAIIRSVVTLGADLGFTTVAEGIETQEQIDAAIELGCDRAQGYFFAKPMPASRVKAFLSRMEMDQTAANIDEAARPRAAGG